MWCCIVPNTKIDSPYLSDSCNLEDCKQQVRRAEAGPQGNNTSQWDNIMGTVNQLLSYQTLEPNFKIKSSINSTTVAN